MNIFELASKQALRFPSVRGELTTEQLWGMHLQSKSGFDLDSVAKTVNASLKSVTEESFVATTTNPAKTTLELKMEILKHVIAAKLVENEEARTRAANAVKKEKLLAILGDKQDEALKSLSPEELQAQIAALSA